MTKTGEEDAAITESAASNHKRPEPRGCRSLVIGSDRTEASSL
ncbi:MAG: hypothetical protein U9O06_09540 [Euryarchaeota archaeon]|nr:hypothetical protein [Euryarchaeota archaeon]